MLGVWAFERLHASGDAGTVGTLRGNDSSCSRVNAARLVQRSEQRAHHTALLFLPLPHFRPAVVPEWIEGMPLTEVRLVNIKLITLAELKLITDRGAEGRRKLSELLAGDSRLVSSIQRESVLS